MKGDVVQLLRQADPAQDGGDYQPARIARQVARILQDAEPLPVTQPRSVARRLAVPVVAACTTLVAVGLAAVTVAGWFGPPPARNTSDNPAWQQLSQQFGASADPFQARERVSAPGPEGSTMVTWTVPVTNRGSCTAILLTKNAEALSTDDGQGSNLARYCEQDPAAVQQAVRFTELVWHSTATDTDYLIYSGPLNSAATVELQLGSGARLKAAINNGYYLLPAVPSTDLACGALVGRDRKGRQIGLPSFVGISCPVAGRLGTQIVQDPFGMVITEPNPSQPVSYSDGIKVAVDAVIEQNPTRGLGAAGMALITVRLRFSQQLSGPRTSPQTEPKPASALAGAMPFALLYGTPHRPASPDPGMLHDPDLNGVQRSVGTAPTSWLLQRSFDVPVDQLASMQVRINSDAGGPIIVFDHVRVTGPR